MEHPKAVGDKSTLAIMLALREAGFALSVPFGENTRYDLVADDGVRLRRVQCKTGRLRSGAIRFAVCSCYGHHLRPANARRDYHGEVDDFAVYCPETRRVYLVPISDLPLTTQAALRVEPARNRQAKGIRMASAYELAAVAVTVKAGLAASAGG